MAALFGVHPVSVEAVARVTARKDPLLAALRLEPTHAGAKELLAKVGGSAS